MTSEQHFSAMIRALADEMRLEQENEQRMININRLTMRQMLGHIAVKENLSVLELDTEIGISKRTISKLTTREGNVYMLMQAIVVDKILEYAYHIAEIYDTLNEQEG